MADQNHRADRSKNEDQAVEAIFRNNVTNIVPVELEKEMKTSFIDYAMSVITDRALPDVRDGLKPVHRRILYSMFTQGFTADKPFRKCATTVGDVLGRFHPHGDAAVYESLVRLAQDFSMRHMLVDGHGNFGSRDGDPAAAYRYTEARLTKIAAEMMSDINKNTVDFQPNFDEHEMEPTVLPAHFPNLLVNGSTGIAVGMATNIPPHNLGEVIDGAIHLLRHPEASVNELMQFIPGPDFPTGGTILGTSGIRQAYMTGRGRIVVRAAAVIEDMAANRQRIVVSDLPYMVNKARLIEKIAELVKEKRLDGISFVRDESDRNQAVRIVIELKRDANANVVLNRLYRMTQLQENFSANILALVPEAGHMVPRVINLKDALAHYASHQKEVTTRRTRFELEKAEARKHIVEGLRIAIDNIDEVIRIIRSSKHEDEAKERLCERFGFSDRQAQHIVDMRLGRLTGLERDKLEKEYNDLLAQIDYYNSILSDEAKLIEVIVDELNVLKAKYADERRTTIDPTAEEITDESLIKEENVVITMTHFGYVKRMPVDTYSMQHRGGRGIKGMQMREDDYVKMILTTSTHDYVFFFTDRGRVFRLKGYQIPEESRQARGLPIVNLLQLAPDEKIQTILPLPADGDAHYLTFATRQGLVKRTLLTEFDNINRAGLIAISLREDDELIGVALTSGYDDLLLVTSEGMSIRFAESDCRPMGRNTMGVKGISIGDDDALISMVKIAGQNDLVSGSRPIDDSEISEADGERLADDDAPTVVETGEVISSDMLLVSSNGFGKKTAFGEYRVQNRGGKGLITYKPNLKTGPLVAALPVATGQELIMVDDNGLIIRISGDEIPTLGRTATGVMLMRSKAGSVVDVAAVDPDEEEDEEILDLGAEVQAEGGAEDMDQLPDVGRIDSAAEPNEIDEAGADEDR